MRENPEPGRKLIRLLWGSKHGPQVKVQLISLTGFTLLLMEPLKNMMDLLRLLKMDKLLRKSQAKFWYSLNLMLPAFLVVVSAIHLRQEDILHGMFRHPCLSDRKSAL